MTNPRSDTSLRNILARAALRSHGYDDSGVLGEVGWGRPISARRNPVVVTPCGSGFLELVGGPVVKPRAEGLCIRLTPGIERGFVFRRGVVHVIK